jgi:hypothetical protein
MVVRASWIEEISKASAALEDEITPPLAGPGEKPDGNEQSALLVASLECAKLVSDV